jgi:hypothetical protein
METNTANADTGPNAETARRKTSSVRGHFDRVTSRFVQEIDSLSSTLPLAMHSINAARRQASETRRKFIVENAKEADEKLGTVRIETNDFLRLQRLSRRSSRTAAASTLVPRSFLVALVSQFDNFLGLLIGTLLLTKPELLNASEKTLSLSELLDFGSIDAARNHVIEKEVESVLRKSHTEQFEWLEAHFKINLREELAVWPQFIELKRAQLVFHRTGQPVLD